jgi:hypothetical protein
MISMVGCFMTSWYFDRRRSDSRARMRSDRALLTPAKPAPRELTLRLGSRISPARSASAKFWNGARRPRGHWVILRKQVSFHLQSGRYPIVCFFPLSKIGTTPRCRIDRERDRVRAPLKQSFVVQRTMNLVQSRYVLSHRLRTTRRHAGAVVADRRLITHRLPTSERRSV